MRHVALHALLLVLLEMNCKQVAQFHRFSVPAALCGSAALLWVACHDTPLASIYLYIFFIFSTPNFITDNLLMMCLWDNFFLHTVFTRLEAGGLLFIKINLQTRLLIVTRLVNEA